MKTISIFVGDMSIKITENVNVSLKLLCSYFLYVGNFCLNDTNEVNAE